MTYVKQTWVDDVTLVDATRLNHMEDGIASGAVVTNVKDFGAKGDGVTDDTVAIKAAIDASRFWIMGGTQGLRRPLYFPAGRYVISESLMPVSASGDDFHMFGDGWTVTYLTLKNGVNAPLLDLSNFSHKFVIHDISFGCWDAAGQATHTQNAFPIVKATASYISTFRNVLITYCPGDGVQIGGALPGVATDAITFFDCMVTNCLGHGIFSDRSPSMKVIGGAIESNSLYDIYVKGDPTVTFEHGLVTGTRFEAQVGRAAIYLERATGFQISGNYFNAGVGVYLDESSHGNVVTANQFLSGSVLYDAGFLNTTVPNDGVFNPILGQLHRHLPVSRISDGDGTSTAVFWTGRNRSGGSGTLSKLAPPGSLTEARFDEIAGRGAPVQVSPASANGYSAFQDITVVPAESYLFDLYWTAEASASATFQIQLTDTAVATVYYDSGALSRALAPNEFGWRLNRASFVFTVPAAVTTLRVLLSAVSATPVYLDRVSMVKVGNPNGGMEGTYAAGVCANWAVSQSGGSPVKAQETTIVRPAMIGAPAPTGTQTPASQKLSVVGSGTEYIELACTPVYDLSRLHLLRGFVYVAAGDPRRARIAWGSGSFSGQNYKFRLNPPSTGKWEAVSRVFKPSDTANNLLISLVSGSTPATAYFDDIAVVPLRELLTEKTAVSQEFTLSAAAASQVVVAPSVDSVLRRITVVYTVASDANTGVALNVGTYANASYYATAASQASQAQGTQVELGLSKTDIVRGRPIVVACAGGKTGTGKVQIALEYE